MQASLTPLIAFFYMKTVHFWEPLPELSSPSFRSGSLLGPFFLAVCGVFFGIFLGGWILALAEIAKVFPVFARRRNSPRDFPCDRFHCCRKNSWLPVLLRQRLDVTLTASLSSYERIFHMRNIDEKKYEQYVKQLTPTHSLPLNMAKAFLTGRTDLPSWPGHYQHLTVSRCRHFRCQNLVFCTSHPLKCYSHRIGDLPEDRKIRRCRKPCSHYRFC